MFVLLKLSLLVLMFSIFKAKAGVPVNIPCLNGGTRQGTTVRSCVQGRTKCTPVPQNLCALVYDDGGCEGWKLDVPEGDMMFKWWDPVKVWYRNDIEQISVRAGCTLTAFDDSSLNGRRVTIRAVNKDRHVELASDAEYRALDEEIQSISCTCWI